MFYKLLVQYVWIIFLLIALIPFIPIYPTIKTKDFISRNIKWNSNSTPVWFLHSSDLHLSSIFSESYPHVKGLLSKSINYIKPKKIILTGDLARNYNIHPNRPYNKQNQNDWNLLKEMYNDLKLNDERTISVAGNHDLFLIPSFNSSNHYANGFLYDKDSFLMNVTYFNQDKLKIKFITINMFQFPSGPICFLQVSYMTKEFKKLLEKELEKNDSNYTYIISHFPILRFINYEQIVKIMSKSKNLRFFISGHLHPKNGMFLHFGDTFEVIGPPLFKTNNFGLITIDNFHSAYHIIDMNNPPIAIMTNPTPLNQASGYDTFIQKNSEIRALLFSNKQNANLSVCGAVKGRLNCSRKLQENIYLCSLPFNLKSGKYHLEKCGDWEGSIDFVTNGFIKGFKEKHYDILVCQKQSIISSVANLIFLIYILSPCFKTKKIEFKFILFRSISKMRSNISILPFYLKFIFTFSVIYIILFPHCFFKNEYLNGFMFAFGYFQGNTFNFHYIGLLYFLYFLYFHLYPLLILVNDILSSKRNCFILGILTLIPSFWGVWYEMWWLRNMFGQFYSLTSPYFIISILLYVSTFIWIVNHFKANISKVKEDDLENLI